MRRDRAALATGLTTLALVAVCCALAWESRSPLVPRLGGTAVDGSSRSFLLALAVAFAAYLLGLALLRTACVRLAAVALVAAAIQLAPLGAPLLLSTDAWTYWDYGRVAVVHGSNPYVVSPQHFPDDPAFRHMGAAWRGKTSVYGPAFTLASEPVAAVVGESADAAAWTYKAIAAVATLCAAGLAGRLARRRSLAVAFVGWNPLLAIHLGGGGHNDAWVGALLLAALALSAGRRSFGAGVIWAIAIATKWVPIVFLALEALGSSSPRRRAAVAGLLAGGGVAGATASWRYGWHWLAALMPLTDNARLETSYALPHRLQGVGLSRAAALTVAVVVLVGGLAWLSREALRGRPRSALAACLVLATTPYLAVWYLGWAVPLAAADDGDRLARAAVLGLCAYLLPQTIPY